MAQRDRIDEGPGSSGDNLLAAASTLRANGFKLLATEGTATYLQERGIPAEVLRKVHEGSSNVVDAIQEGRAQLVINSPAGSDAEYDDSIIRKAAIRAKVPYVTTTSEAYMAALGIAEYLRGSERVRSLQEWHATIS